MVFKRRDHRTFWRRCLAFVLPEGGYARGWKYIGKRVQRIRDTPEKIALGFACGALASFTPLFGCHFFVAAFFAWLLRANIVSSLFGTIVGNPVTFPFIATGALSLGRIMTGRESDNVDGEGIISSFADVGGLLWNSLLQGIGIEVANAVSWSATKVQFWEFWNHVMVPYFAGGMFIGIFVAVGLYFIIKPAIAAYQKRRREKLSACRNSGGIVKLKSGKKAQVS